MFFVLIQVDVLFSLHYVVFLSLVSCWFSILNIVCYMCDQGSVGKDASGKIN